MPRRGDETWDRELAEDLHVVPLEGDRRPLTTQSGQYSEPSVSPDGKVVAFLGIDDPLTDPQNRRVGLLDLAPASGGGSRPATSTARGHRSPAGAAADRDGDGLVVGCEDRGDLHVYRVGEAPPALLLGGERVVTGYDRAGGTMAFTVSTVDRPAELYVTVGDGPERRLTTVTERFAARARLQPAERFVAPSTDDVEVDCWVITPPTSTRPSATPCCSTSTAARSPSTATGSSTRRRSRPARATSS